MTLSEIQDRYAETDDPSKRMELIESVIVLNLVAWDEAAAFLARILVNDPNAIVRHEAAFALGELRGRELTGESTCEEVLCHAATTDESAVVRHEAAEALYCFPGERAEAALRQLLSDESEDVRLTAAISLSWRREFIESKMPTRRA